MATLGRVTPVIESVRAARGARTRVVCAAISRSAGYRADSPPQAASVTLLRRAGAARSPFTSTGTPIRTCPAQVPTDHPLSGSPS